jgi:hypothetical protein
MIKKSMSDFGTKIAIYLESDGSDAPEIKLISRETERYEETKRQLGIHVERISEDHPAVEAIEQEFNSLYNNGATNGELQWISKGSGGGYVARFWTSKSKTLNALIKSTLSKLIQDDPSRYKGVKGGAMAEAKKIATEVFEGIGKGYKHVSSVDERTFNVAV